MIKITLKEIIEQKEGNVYSYLMSKGVPLGSDHVSYQDKDGNIAFNWNPFYGFKFEDQADAGLIFRIGKEEAADYKAWYLETALVCPLPESECTSHDLANIQNNLRIFHEMVDILASRWDQDKVIKGFGIDPNISYIKEKHPAKYINSELIEKEIDDYVYCLTKLEQVK